MKLKENILGEILKLDNFKLKPIVSAVQYAVQKIWEDYNEKEKVKNYIETTRIINIIKNSPTLSDVFEVSNDWWIIVKNPWRNQSKLLSGHFPLEWITVTQWVALRQLYEEVSGVKPNKEFNTRYVEFPQKWITPGSKLKVVKDGIIDENWEQILKYELEEWSLEEVDFYKNEVKFNNFFWTKTLNNWDVVGDFILHSGIARVVDEAIWYYQEDSKISVWDVFQWHYIIKDIQELLDKDWNFNQTFLDETAAQVASVWFSYVENKELLERYWKEAKEQNNFRLLTYKTTKNRIFSDKNILLWEEITSFVRIAKINVEKWKIKSIEAEYVVLVWDELIQSWRIEWLNVAVKILKMWLRK